jgi:hypothetical protein
MAVLRIVTAIDETSRSRNPPSPVGRMVQVTHPSRQMQTQVVPSSIAEPVLSSGIYLQTAAFLSGRC